MATSGAQIRDWVSGLQGAPRPYTANEVIDAMPTPSISVRASDLMPMTPKGEPIATERAPTINVTRRRRTTPKAVPVVKPRAARWNPPTRWTKPPRRFSASPLVLLALIAFAALAVMNGWIDLEAWRALLA
jgi:hypothetical protein